MSQELQKLTFRTPSTCHRSKGAGDFTPPSLDFLRGPWHVTHSTLPMWKSNRSVVITYNPAEANTGGIHDLVTYKPLNSDKQKSIHGFDTPDAAIPACYKWRGKGWLRVTSSQWEILGYGDEEDGWVVTYFQKTMFSPAGIDIYAKKHGGLSEGLLERIVSEVKKVDDAGFQKIVGNLFAIKHDWSDHKDHITHKHY
jgi:hypothetical protein